MFLSGVPVIAAGCLLTGFLAKRPRAGLAVTLLVLSTFLLWKNFVADIVWRMHPALGGYTFTQSLAICWSSHTLGLLQFVLWVAPIILIVASMIFYPLYALMSRNNSSI